MTIEQEQRCAIEALSRASDVTQRLMFREGAKWMDAEHAKFAADACKVVADEWKAIHDKTVSEHAAALAKSEERVRELEEALRWILSHGWRTVHMGRELQKLSLIASGEQVKWLRAALEGK